MTVACTQPHGAWRHQECVPGFGKFWGCIICGGFEPLSGVAERRSKVSSPSFNSIAAFNGIARGCQTCIAGERTCNLVSSNVCTKGPGPYEGLV
jgi:hypothetical protein